MTHPVGSVFISHSGWRLARPDSDYELIVLPARCDGDLLVESVTGGLVTLACDRCQFEVTTADQSARAHPDSRVESQASNEMPF